MTERLESLSITHGGKGEAVRRMTSEGVENVCLCWDNADITSGCIARVPVELLLEVVENNGSYAPGNFGRYLREGKLDDHGCLYCYGRGMNYGNVRPRDVNMKTRKSFERYHPVNLRCGKFSEAGHPYHHGSLRGLLDLCEEFGTGLILTTKMFPFGIEGAEQTADYSRAKNSAVAEVARQMNIVSGVKLAERLRRIQEKASDPSLSKGLTLSYSIGWDAMEVGACSQGFTNDWRIEQAKKYSAEGVHTVLTVVADLGHSIEENVRRGNAIQKALDARSEGLTVRLLPLRPNTREVTGFIADCGFKGLIYDTRDSVLSGMEEHIKFDVVNGVEQRPYQRARSAQELIVRNVHSDFQNLIDGGMGVCGQIGDCENCDKCDLTPGARINFPANELPIRKKDYPKRKKPKDKKQGSLF